MNKKIKIGIGIIVLVLIGWFFVGQNNEPKINGSIKIGAILPLTGNLASIGEDIKRSINLAVNSSEIPIEIYFEDSKGDAKEGVTAINKLISNDVKYVYCFGTSIIKAIQPITERKGVLLAGVSLDSSILEESKYTIRFFYNSEQFLTETVKFIKNQNYSKISALYQQADVLNDQIEYLESEGIVFEQKEQYKVGEQDFRTNLLKIKKQGNPDTLVLLGYGFHYPNIFKQMKELGMDDIKVIGNLGFIETPEESTYLFDNSAFFIPSFKVNPTGESLKFTQNYEKEYGISPTHQSGYAYDMINLLALGIKAKSNDVDQITKFLKKVDQYEGVVGTINISETGNLRSSLILATYKNGELIKN